MYHVLYYKFRPTQWRIQDFPEKGALTSKGAPAYYLANFSRKLHENEEILGHGARVPHALLRSATATGRKDLSD